MLFEFNILYLSNQYTDDFFYILSAANRFVGFYSELNQPLYSFFTVRLEQWKCYTAEHSLKESSKGNFKSR